MRFQGLTIRCAGISLDNDDSRQQFINALVLSIDDEPFEYLIKRDYGNTFGD